MIVYQTDANGYLVGPVEADPHPLRPGEFIIPGGATETAPPTIPGGKRARLVAGVWTLVAAAPAIPTPPALSPAEVLAREREAMQPYARAFFAALALLPMPGFLHMLDAYTQHVASLPPYDPLRIWDQRVTIILRTHPDMEAFGAAFGLTDTALDQIFRVAIAIENGAGPAEIAALLA